jgi:hypothetical protein
MPSLKTIGCVVLVASASVAGYSTLRMAQRVEDFNEVEVSTIWHAQRTRLRQFNFRGLPVSLTDAPRAPDGTSRLTLTYAGTSVELAVHTPPIPNAKDLKAYDEHLAVLAITPNKAGKLQADPFSDEGWRLLVVNRQTAAGYDDDTWGHVRVKDWVFEIYELAPPGTVSMRRVQFPDRAGRIPAEVDARRALKAAGQPVPADDARLTDVEKIEERSIEWQAALFAIPKAQMSRYRFKTDAVKGSDDAQGMRWTLPAAGFGMMGVVAGVTLLMMGSARRVARVSTSSR